ncbi:DUF3857 domain-containing protein [Shivajiella indica]|uniref:DUF3857 domain-containing protein n=1 Tax=Shivajiella indica TaxID=872115 RepID=A0ABW5B8V5_9BACT
MKIQHSLLILFVCLISSLGLLAQDMKFGKYSQDEINLNRVEFEPEASAVVLEEISHNQFMGVVQHSNIHRRIKILKDGGKSQGDVAIRFYFGKTGVQDVSKLSAQTVNFENGEEKVTKLSKADFFEVELDNGWKEIRFTFPNVGVGSIIEYSYLKTDKSITFLESWVFHNSIPTIKSTYTIDLPTYLNYRFLSQGEKTLNTNFKTQRDGLYSWTVKELTSIKEEPFMSHYRDYLEKIDFQLAGYAFVNSSEYGGKSGFQETFSSWQDLTKFITELEEFGQYLKPSSTLRNQLVAFTPIGNTEIEKAKSVYDFIVNNYSFNGKSGFFPSKNLKSILESRQGTRADINLTLLSYLRQNGISAQPLLISSKGNGRSRLVDTPFIDQFDQLIIYSKIGGKEYYLDATDKNNPFGYIPLPMHVTYGYVMLEEGSGLIPVNISHRSGIQQMVNIKLDNDNQFVASSTIRFSDYDALINDKINLVASPEKFKAELFGVDSEKVSDFEVQQKNEPRKQIEAKFKYLGNGIDSDLVLVTPFQMARWEENPLNSDIRTFPVDFLYTFSDSYTSILEIPQGFELDDYPEDATVALPGGDANFSYQITTLDNSVKVSATINLKYSIISPSIYPELKYFMEMVTGKLGEPIVFKKLANP